MKNKKIQRWSNKPWNPSEEELVEMHHLRKRGWSYREMAISLSRDHSTIRRYYLRWLENRNWVSRFFDWLTK